MNKLHLGKLTYLFLTVQSLFTMQTTDAAAVFDGKGQQNRKKMIFAAAMNFRAEGGGVPMAPGADAQDGKLSVTNCKEYDLKLKTPMVLHADGEYCGDVTEMHFQCLPKKLHVMW